MTILDIEGVYASRRWSEEDRASIGLGTHTDKGFNRLVSEIGTWKNSSLSLREIGNLQIFLSRDPNHSTQKIYRLVKSAKVKDIAKLVAEPDRYGGDEQSRIWLSTIDRTLASRVRNNELEPLIVCLPGLPEAGNFLDGNHRAIAAYAFSENLDERLPVIIGEIAIAQWMLLFAKGFMRSKLPITQRIEIASERLHSISANRMNI